MRRALVTTMAIPALLLAACGSDDGPSVEESSNQEGEQAQETTTEPSDDAEQTTRAPADDAESTTGPAGGGAVEGGAAGRAAAARTKEFMVALVNADPEICDLILDFEGEAPMADSPDALKTCRDVLPASLEGLVGEEEAAIIDVIEVQGAEVDGNTAIVDRDNFSDLFAEGFGNEQITLQRVDGEWYVDLDNSFQSGS